jgi:hypothetical protein
MFFTLIDDKPAVLNVGAFSRIKLVECTGGETCARKHIKVGSFAKRKDDLATGCYVLRRGGKKLAFQPCWYTGYHLFRHELARLALGVQLEDIWDHPRRFKGQPFVELLDFPDSGGKVIGPETSAKLHADFSKFASIAKQHFYEVNPRKRKRPQPNDKYRRNCSGFLTDALTSKEVGQRVFKPWEVEDFKWMWTVYGRLRRAFMHASDQGIVKLV